MTRWCPPLALMALVLLSSSSASAAEQIVVDGRFDEWSEVPTAASDPAGDADSAFDLRRVSATSRATRLYLRIKTQQPLNLQTGPEEQGTLRLHVSAGDGRLQLDCRARRITLLRDESREPLRWHEVGYRVAPTHAADEYELSLDLRRLGVERGDRVSIRFSGSDQLDAPISFQLREPDVPRRWRSPDRTAGTDLRLVSFNVMRDGLTDEDRRGAIARLLRAADPDVLCLQELFSTGREETRQALEQMLQAEGEGRWHVHRRDDCVVASRWPVEPAPADEHGYAAAIVRHPDQPLLVISAHLRCCGHTGSEEDQRRIEQARSIARTIRQVHRDVPDRRADDGESEHRSPGGPAVIIAGDLNVVGSPRPLEILREATEPALNRWPLRHLDDRSVVTWYDEELDFAPGVLNMLLHGQHRLQRAKGFILDTRRLNDALLERLQLERTDSNASDHLPLISDFTFR